MATDAASGWVLDELEDGKPAPEASPLESIAPESGGFVNLLVLDMDSLTTLYPFPQHHRQIYPSQDTLQCASDCIHQRKRQIPVACAGAEKPVRSRGKADRQSWHNHSEG